jgi:proteic killer suppression protein
MRPLLNGGTLAPPVAGHDRLRLACSSRRRGLPCVYPYRGYTHVVEVELSHIARKQLLKVPSHIVRKFALWCDLVSIEGLEAARASRGFRDHALKGKWQGYRAVRLSDAYRAIYIVRSARSVEAVYVEEVNKHDY